MRIMIPLLLGSGAPFEGPGGPKRGQECVAIMGLASLPRSCLSRRWHPRPDYYGNPAGLTDDIDVVRAIYRAGVGRLEALLAIEPAPTPTRVMALWALPFLIQGTGKHMPPRALSALEEACAVS